MFSSRSLLSAVTALTLLAAGPALAQPRSWEADPTHTQIGFSVRHLMLSNVRGEFAKYTVKVQADPKDLSRASVEVAIEVKSISTGVAKRDEHLRSPDFFDAAKYPTISFRSRSVKKLGKDRLEVAGELTLRGVKKPITLAVSELSGPVKDPWGNLRLGFAAEAKLDRKDFGLTWNKALETGGLMVGNEVKVKIEAELVSQTKK